MSVELQTAFIVLIWNLIPALVKCRPYRVALLVWAMTGVILAAPGLRQALLGGFEGDSLFTLGNADRSIVVLIAAAMLIAQFVITVHAAKHLAAIAPNPWEYLLAIMASVGVTGVTYTAGYMISPQLFYQFYVLIFPGLPQQMVISERHFEAFIRAIGLPPDGSLADISAGAGFWTFIGLSISVPAVAWRNMAGGGADPPDTDGQRE